MFINRKRVNGAMNGKGVSKWARYGVLAGLLFVLYAIDFVGLSLSDMVRTAPLLVLLAAVLDTAAIAFVVSRMRLQGRRMGVAIFLLVFGLKTFLVGIEAVYLSDVLPPAVARALFVNGLIVAAVFAPAAVWLLPAGTGDGRQAEGLVFAPKTTPAWLGKLLLAGVIYLVLFIAGGLLLFTPLANALDAAGAAAYTAGFEAPAWLPLFVAARGMLWALLALPAVGGFGERSWGAGLALGLVFALLMANNLLFPGEIAPAIRAAHYVELFVENLLYGLALVWLFAPERVREPATDVVSSMAV